MVFDQYEVRQLFPDWAVVLYLGRTIKSFRGPNCLGQAIAWARGAQ